MNDDGCMDKSTDGWIDEWIMYRQRDVWTDGWMMTVGWMDRQMEWVYGQSNNEKQTDATTNSTKKTKK